MVVGQCSVTGVVGGMPDGGEKIIGHGFFYKLFIVNCLCKMAMPDRARFLSEPLITLIALISRMPDFVSS